MKNQKGRRVKKDIFGVFEKHIFFYKQRRKIFLGFYKKKYEQGWIIYKGMNIQSSPICKPFKIRAQPPRHRRQNLISQKPTLIINQGCWSTSQAAREKGQDIYPWSTVYPRVVMSQRGVQFGFKRICDRVILNGKRV